MSRATKASTPGPRAQEVRCGRLSVMLSRPAGAGSLFVDLFVDGQDESILALRLDADENTATLYDARRADDEGETIYQGEPLRGALAATATRGAAEAWRPRVGARCLYRGAWGLRPPVAGVITGQGEKNGRRVYDVELDEGGGIAWGYLEQFGPEGVR